MKAIQRLKQAGLTRTEIGAACRVGRHAVGRWERGEVAPSGEALALLIALADAHGIVLLAHDLIAVPAFSVVDSNAA